MNVKNTGAILFLALKDVTKDKKTLLMIILVIGVGVTASLLISGLFNGYKSYFYDMTINTMTGHLTIFPKENEHYITGVKSMERKIELLPEVKGLASRIVANGIALRENKEVQVRITGLTPSREIKTTRIADKVTSGEFLSDSDNSVLLGSVLADNLNVKVGEKTRITFRNGAIREYKVKGFLDTGTRSGDETAAYLTNRELEDVLGINDAASQIIIKLTDTELVDKSKTNILQLGINGEIKTWKELSTYIETITQNFNFIAGIITFISLTAAAISVAVVMFINVERKTREIGILKAIGARNSFVMSTFLTEIFIYAFLGVISGAVLGNLTIGYFQAVPAVRMQFGGTGGVETPIIPVASFSDVASSSILVFLVTFLAGLYPVNLATKTDIIKAIWSG